MAETRLHLTIVSQERQLIDQLVDAITAPASEGEITILAGHIPLMSKLQYGELRYLYGTLVNCSATKNGCVKKR